MKIQSSIHARRLPLEPEATLTRPISQRSYAPVIPIIASIKNSALDPPFGSFLRQSFTDEFTDFLRFEVVALGLNGVFQ
jgi:hypothetical protein